VTRASDVVPLHLADVTYPDGHPLAGRVGPVLAFAVRLADGVVLVDTGVFEGNAWIDEHYQPRRRAVIQYIINTNADPDHVGGNDVLSKAGLSIISATVGNAVFGLDAISNGGAASILAHDNVLARMSDVPFAEWPTKTYTARFYKMSLNGDGIEVFHQPSSLSDGDSFVLFRRANVIVTGDLFDTTRYPFIDVKNGGSVQGLIRALNFILDRTVYRAQEEGGTMIVPGHGRLGDTADVAIFRNMVVVVRDRIQDMIKSGMTVEQVKAAKPTLDFDGRYGSDTGSWTTSMFIEAVYQTLKKL